MMTNKNAGVTEIRETPAGRMLVNPKGQTVRLRYVKINANGTAFNGSGARRVSLVRKIPERNGNNQDQETVE